MTLPDPAPVFLIAPPADGARVRAIAAGIEATLPRYAPVFPNGADESFGRRAGHALRMLLGDEPPTRHPDGPMGPRWIPSPMQRPCVAAWVVGPVDDIGGLCVDAAAKHEIPIVRMERRDCDRFIEGGIAAAERATRATTERVIAGVLADIFKRPDFRGARAVVIAYFRSETWEMGGGGIDYERALSAVQSSGGCGFRDRVEHIGLQMAAARRVIRAASLSTTDLAALRWRELHGHSFRQVAIRLGWPDDGNHEDKAWRLVRRALGKIGRALRESERREQ